jgi:hypothetical protein
MFGFQTDESENEHIQEIKAVDDPAVTIGRMEITWTPLTADDEVKEEDPYDIIEEPAMLLGKTWKYQLLIKGVQALPFVVCQARVQYTFYGELYTTDTCNRVTVSPTFGEDDDSYQWVHEVRSPSCTRICFTIVMRSFRPIQSGAQLLTAASALSALLCSPCSGRGRRPRVYRLPAEAARVHAACRAQRGAPAGRGADLDGERYDRTGEFYVPLHFTRIMLTI